jgi:hypothetical protein
MPPAVECLSRPGRGDCVLVPSGHPRENHQVRSSAWLLLVLLLAACTSGPRTPQVRPAPTTGTAASPTASATRLGRPGCRPPSPISRGNGFPEVQGTSDGLRMWGLIMANGPDNPLRTDEDVKIVWRITGSGPLRLTTLDPGGRAHPLAWGPDPHLSSTYERPGDEWGAGYRFTEPGCWTLRATRGAASANVWLDVAP